MKYLKPNLTAWGFEVNNNNEAKYDGAVIIANDYVYPESPHPFSHFNLYSKGRITINSNGDILDNQPSGRFFDRQDLLYIWEKVNA